MTLNYLILGLIFFAGTFLVLAAAFNARFLSPAEPEKKEAEPDELFDDGEENKKTATPFLKLSNPFSRFFSNKRRTAYLFLGVVIIILGIVALLNGFLDEKIEI